MVEEQKEPDMVEKAAMTAERIEKANAQQAELIKKMEAIEARRILGGQTEAGATQEKPHEETAIEYAKRILRGGK